MKISVPALLVIAAPAKSNKVSALSDNLNITSNETSTSDCDILHGRDDCVQYAPHNDPQGIVCGNDIQNNEAYCNFINYQTDATNCLCDWQVRPNPCRSVQA